MTADAVTDPTVAAQGVFLQYGAIGVILLILLWFAYGAIKREREATDRERAGREKAEAEKDDLNRILRTEVIPVLTKATEAITDVGRALVDRSDAGRDRR